ncbi:hypothetical protein [Campylobacter ureolyticus]|uniref:Uncharacterized protein n=1 Tax=Campylobacter ureolyticus TaxID=827 RepID=A0A9Q4PUR3_9BACT|nr:hypothetical protein [Campylobacter ureolyticus]MCZ6103449.1 hypothetical protein [Campylobacter ureolyticus]MCZ6134129.1 hypothetical protein [Campylobacter ureolyticus]MCZ6162397.1 hypothetical protein [Campylobacter ureolyticus]MCZ6170542.1 hypothetical protein [Campylobacter ureolyticus]MDU4982093.1 hypothetical protein [Campylobacter ureolyticus]
MSEISRRNFFKTGVLSTFFLSNYSFADSFKIKDKNFLIYDENLKISKNYAFTFANKEKLRINKDVSEIYFDLKDKFRDDFISSGITSKETFFVIKNIAKDFYYQSKEKVLDDGLVSWILFPSSNLNIKRSLA